MYEYFVEHEDSCTIRLSDLTRTSDEMVGPASEVDPPEIPDITVVDMPQVEESEAAAIEDLGPEEVPTPKPAVSEDGQG